MSGSDADARSLDWMARGACQREDPELFFPIAASGPGLLAIKAAKAVCQGCAVRVPCLSYGVQTRQDGIWGGTTAEERSAIRRQAEPVPAGSLQTLQATSRT